MAAVTEIAKTADVAAKTADEGDKADEEEVKPERKCVFDITYDYPNLANLEKELRESKSIGDFVKNKEPDLLPFIAKEFADKTDLKHEDITVGVSCAIYDYFKKKEKELGDKEFVMYKFNYAAALVHIGKGNKLD